MCICVCVREYEYVVRMYVCVPAIISGFICISFGRFDKVRVINVCSYECKRLEAVLIDLMDLSKSEYCAIGDRDVVIG